MFMFMLYVCVRVNSVDVCLRVCVCTHTHVCTCMHTRVCAHDTTRHRMYECKLFNGSSS